jgi:hypothetical protein
MSELAICGGNPVLAEPLRPYQTIGRAEVEAVKRVAESGLLSGFHGSSGPQFLGGPMVREFENALASAIPRAPCCVSQFRDIGLDRGDGCNRLSHEVIVPPYTMSATIAAPLI